MSRMFFRFLNNNVVCVTRWVIKWGGGRKTDLAYRGRNTIGAISKTTFSNACSSMKMHENDYYFIEACA